MKVFVSFGETKAHGAQLMNVFSLLKKSLKKNYKFPLLFSTCQACVIFN